MPVSMTANKKKQVPDLTQVMLMNGGRRGTKQGGGGGGRKSSWFHHWYLSFLAGLHQVVDSLNTSKFFAGIMMIVLNIGSRYVQVKFSSSTEEYVRMAVGKQILIFAVAWMGTRDIYMSLGLVAIFTVLSEYLFNEDSDLCIVPMKYRRLNNAIDTNDDGKLSKEEINRAIEVLEKAKKNVT